MGARIVEILLVAGARPNFMKVAPLMRALVAYRGRVEAQLVHTGQHYDESMSQVFLDELGIPPPAVHLGATPGTHGEQTAFILAAFERTLLVRSAPPAGVVVVGDVNSTLACTLAAVKVGVPVAHVEAGLRSRDRSMPEEINRILTDAVADLLFVSEPDGETNLRAEGIDADRIHYVGNVMIDSLVAHLPAAREQAHKWASPRGPHVLVTLHRPANVDDPQRLADLVDLLIDMSGKVDVVFPAHPRTRRRLEESGCLARLEAAAGIRLLNPVGYRTLLGLLVTSAAVLTDSGGLQEESTFLGVPCLTLRRSTERPATVRLGTNTVVDGPLMMVPKLLEDIRLGRYKRGAMIRGWDGHAAERIAAILVGAWA